MKFVSDWFSQNEKNWGEWLKDFKYESDLRFLEIGCYDGRATLWLLQNILTGINNQISVIDTFKGSPENSLEEKTGIKERFLENVKVYIDEGMVKVYEGSSQFVLRMLQGNSFDFVYVDGSHTSPDVLEDTILAWGMLREGGILIWDDYGWHLFDDRRQCPAMAIDAFLSIFKDEYEVISKGYQVCIRKK